MATKEGPDQARSWAIAMAGCVINGLLSGISRTTGLFYVALIETYGVSRMEANLPFTLRNVVRNLGGPLAGAIGQRYGARDVTFIGGIFASLGILLCYLAPNVLWICILWGGLHGFGVALGNTLFPVIVNQYFLKYRATASGLSLSGACIGSFILPSAIEFMLVSYGLPGTFLISGGLIMHVLPAAILMVEPSWIVLNPSKEKSVPDNERSMHTASENLNNSSKIKVDQVLASDFDVDGVSKLGGNEEQEIFENEKRLNSNGVDNLAFVESTTDISKHTEKNELEKEPTEEIRMRTVSIGETNVTFPSSQKKQETSISKGLLQMLRNPMFYVISVSLAGFAMLFDPSITVIVDYVHDKGLKENDAKYFISVMSLGDLVGRLCFGWVTDRNYMTLAKFMLLMHAVQGVCFLLMPLFNAFEVLIVIIAIYGLASGATLVMYPLLVSKYLASVQSLAIGFISVFTGVISFAIPPMIGYFRDYVGSYEGMFLITGSLSLIAGCLWLFEPVLHKKENNPIR